VLWYRSGLVFEAHRLLYHRRYLPYVIDHGPGDSAGGFITFLLLLNNFIPISLYVSMEIAKTVQGLQVPALILIGL